MKESCLQSPDPLGDDFCARAPAPELDWRALAGQRLSRLVELEHDCFVMRDRLEQLQVECSALQLENEAQLERIWRMTRKQEQELARILQSWSWRITRPLRALSVRTAPVRPILGRLLRMPLRVPWVKRAAVAIVLRMPRLHAHVRSRLHPDG